MTKLLNNNFMKKLIFSLAAVVAMATSAFAQDKFFPGWQVGLQGGAGITIGETEQPFKYLLSPAVSLNFGYNFTPLFTLRGNVIGGHAKGVVPTTAGTLSSYGWKYAGLGADAMFDFCSMFAKNYKQRAVNPYIFAGLGAVMGFDNGADPKKLPYENLYWEKNMYTWLVRAGIGIDFRVCDLLAINLEVVDNMVNDRFNSKKGGNIDQQINGLLGVKFYLNQGAKKKAYAEEIALAAALKAAEEAKVAKEKADAEAAAKAAEEARLAAEKLAAEKADAERVAAAKLAAEKAAAEAAAAAKAKACEDAKAISADNTHCHYFKLGKKDIDTIQVWKLKRIVRALKADEKATVVLCGFADECIGSAEVNMTLSEKRANEIEAFLVANGIAAERITKYWFGDTVKISDICWKNRAVVWNINK